MDKIIKYRFRNKFVFALTLIMFNTIIGILGFMWVEGWDFLDSFYQTIITISTIGFTEAREFTDNGKWFVSIYIIVTLGTFAYALGQLTNFFASGEYKGFLEKNKLKNKLKNMENHVIVCGYGRVGKQTTEMLILHQENVLVIDNDQRHKEGFHEESNLIFLKANATNDQSLIDAGIIKAKALISALPEDTDNLFVVLTARALNPNLKIIARAELDSSVKKLKIAGANNVIMPDKLGGSQMAQLVSTPDVVEFLEQISVEGSNEVNLVEIAFKDLPIDLRNQTISEIKRNISFCNIVGYKSNDGEFIINPENSTVVVPNSKFFILGTPSQIESFKKSLSLQ
jgi:voltage-gated potassium channel